MSNALTTAEMTMDELTAKEEVISRGLGTFKEVGAALLEIRDRRGYRFGYSTFEDYCSESWGMTSRRANQLIQASETILNLGTIVPVLPINEAQARPLTALNDSPELQREAWQRAVDTAPDGKITAEHIQTTVDEITQRTRPASQAVAVTIFSNVSMEYYTPSKYIELARKVLGKIDLDPASCEEAQQTVKAKTYYTKDQDGLSLEWRGNVFLNPPYCKDAGKSNQGTWSLKMVDEYTKGNLKQGILLVKAALGYKWFESLFDILPVCFCRERISFINEEGEDDGQSKQGTAFFYIGKDPSKFYAVFREIGRIIPPKAEIDAGLFDE